MKCNKSQMATLTMWKIFMALLLAMALLMPLTLARLHSTSGVGIYLKSEWNKRAKETCPTF